MSDCETLRIGFIPLTDAAILIAAQEKGFATAEGLHLELVRETSWANIRDRIAIGHFDAAHMLAALPIAAALSLTPLAVPLVAPMALGIGGNAITVSRGLWAEMAAAGAPSTGDPVGTGRALRRVIAARRAAGAALPSFAVVHAFSGHHYELRHWLAENGIDPESDVRIEIIPPPFMADALAAATIDGYCVGEPWNTVAVRRGIGHMVTSKAAIWPLSLDKVLGLRRDWQEANRDKVVRLLRALVAAAGWCDAPENRAELASLLSREAYLGVETAAIQPALDGRLELGDGILTDIADFMTFVRHGAIVPNPDDAFWLYAQMLRWGQVAERPGDGDRVRAAMRPDMLSEVLGGTDLALSPERLAARPFSGAGDRTI